MPFNVSNDNFYQTDKMCSKNKFELMPITQENKKWNKSEKINDLFKNIGDNQITLLNNFTQKEVIKPKQDEISEESYPVTPIKLIRTLDYKILSKNFKKRKSKTQIMDFQRNRNFLNAIMPTDSELSLTTNVSSLNNDQTKGTFQIGDSFYYVMEDSNGSEIDLKSAGMRVYASVMLNAWRRRRDDVKKLTEEINRLKKYNLKTKNQIHVLSSLFKIEQKQNDELNNRLKRTKEDLKMLQNKYDNLNVSHLELKTKNSNIESSIQNQSKENEILSIQLQRAQSNLSKVMKHELELKEIYASEQRKCLELEDEKNELINLLDDLKLKSDLKEKDYEEQIFSRNKEIKRYEQQLDLLGKKLSDLQKMEIELKEYQLTDISQRQTIQDLDNKLIRLRNELDISFTNRLKSLFNAIPHKTLAGLYIVTFYLLPAIPAPFRISLNLKRILNHAAEESDKFICSS